MTYLEFYIMLLRNSYKRDVYLRDLEYEVISVRKCQCRNIDKYFVLLMKQSKSVLYIFLGNNNRNIGSIFIF